MNPIKLLIELYLYKYSRTVQMSGFKLANFMNEVPVASFIKKGLELAYDVCRLVYSYWILWL